MDRRDFIIKSATAGAIVWVAPTVYAVSVASAAEHTGSRPPAHPPRHAPHVETPPAPKERELPFTGDDNADLIVAGGAALAAGATLVALTHERREVGDE